MTVRYPGIVTLGITLVACSGAPPAEWAGSVTDSAGVAIVSNPEQGLWGEDTGWGVEETLRIGAAEGQPEYQFGNVAWVDVDAEGRIYVLDQQSQSVRVYDGEGEYLRTIGRPGNGPGELSRAAMAVLVGAHDTIFVPDAMIQRVSRFLPDGSDAGSFPMPLSDGIPMKWQARADGTLVVQMRTMPLSEQLASQEQRNVVLVRGSDGAVRDTLLHLARGETVRFEGGAPRIRLFEPEPLWEVGPDGTIYTGINDDYRIEVRTAAGQLARVITRPFERLPVTDADQQAFKDAFLEAYRRQGIPPQAAQQVMQNISFADHYPAYATLASGPDGSLWVQRIQSADEVVSGGGTFEPQDVGAPEWDVFDAEGRFLGVVAFPDRFRPVRFAGDEVYGIWRDDLDVQHVMRLRITGPAGA